MRFNPPPNWPPVPPGWVPDRNWVPDPTWPPPPPGWQLWLDDGSVAEFPPDYPPPYPPYPAQWPGQPGGRPRRLWWIALAALAVVAVLGVALLVRFGGSQHTSAKPSKKPDITELTSEMLVGRSAFPEIAGGKWISGVNTAGSAPAELPNMTIEPPECSDLYGDSKAATQTATATLANIAGGGLHSTRVRLAITPEQRDLKEYLHKCRTFTQKVESGGRSVTTEVQLEPLNAAGVPPWAVATVMTSTSSTGARLAMSVTAATVAGYYRGVLVVASSNDIRLGSNNDATIDAAAAEALVDLFNAEIEILEASQ